MAFAIAFPLLFAAGAFGFGKVFTAIERYDARLTREWSDRVGEALREMPEFSEATNDVTEAPIPVFVWRGISVVAERALDEDVYGPTRFGFTISGNPLLGHPSARMRLRIAHAPAAVDTTVSIGAQPAARMTAVILAELFRYAREHAEAPPIAAHGGSRSTASPSARAGSAGERLGIVR